MINMQKLLFVVRELHKRGYGKLRIVPSLAPSGLAWRCSFVSKEDEGIVTSTWIDQLSQNGREIELTIEELTDRFERDHITFLNTCRGENEEYVKWYETMLRSLDIGELPYAFKEYFGPTDYWLTSKENRIKTLPGERRFYYNS
jgi:hypothetical protein